MSRSTPNSDARNTRKHNPLDQDYISTGILRNKPSRLKAKNNDVKDDENFVDSKASKKILRIGQELADEDEEISKITESATTFDYNPRDIGNADEDKPEFEEDGAWGDEEEETEEVELSPEDAEVFRKFNPEEQDTSLDEALARQGWGSAGDSTGEQGTNLGDIILEAIARQQAAGISGNDGVQGYNSAMPEDDFEIPEKVVEVYTKIGMILSRYKSGKLPKPFKILPTVPHWEDIIEITRPDQWTANACFEATRIFVSSTPVVAERFMANVLLGKVRDDIAETKKLNPHLFAALKKGLYKPKAWFRGFLFPLVASGTCTLREAHIISAVLVRVSVPVLHSAAALGGLCDIAARESNAGSEGAGATNIFIKAMLEKKYALPFQVIDQLVFHFLRYRNVEPANSNGITNSRTSKLPVIWHQSLLAFAQRYRNDITEDQREALLDMLNIHGHPTIGPEVRRELLAGRGRGVLAEPEKPGVGGDDTMMMD